MHVAHVITRLIVGGAQENTLWNVIDQMRLFGDRVSLITGPGVGPEGSLEPLARLAGVELHLLPELRRNLHPMRDLQSAIAIRRCLRRLSPDLVHTHTSKAGILGRWAASLLGLPTVHTVHGASFHVGQGRLAFGVYRALERWAGPRTDQFITVCDAMIDQYVAAGVAPREKFVTIRSGFDVAPYLNPSRSREEVRRELGLAPDDLVVAKVARLFPLKGHEYWQEALPRLVERAPRLKILLVGDGILRPQIEENLARLGLTDRVIMTGLVAPERIPELLLAADVVMHTSVWEGLARVLPQAMVAGKPVVSFAIDGAHEVVLPEQTGLLVPVGDVPGLVDAVTRLAADPELRERMGRAGRELCATEFAHETMTRRIRTVYERVLAARPARTHG